MIIKVQNSDLCPRYCAGLVKGVKVGEAPEKIQKRLVACGLRPINNIVDICNYVMLETGQPLHAFDADVILRPKAEGSRGSSSKPRDPSPAAQGDVEIIIRNAKPGEKITTLEKKTYTLNENILLIADQEDPLAIAGIKGGKKAEITAETENIILEAAIFEPTMIRRASQELALITDASQRFERGVDWQLPPKAIKRVVELLDQAEVAEKEDVYPQKWESSKIFFDFRKNLAGLPLKEKQAKKILKLLGFKIEGKYVIPPSWRYDISIKEDIIEEIMRVYGYDEVKPEMPQAQLVVPQEDDLLSTKKQVIKLLTSLGLSQFYNYSLIEGQEEDRLLIKDQNKYLRRLPDLVNQAIEKTARNLKNFDEVRWFEIGRVYKKDKEPNWLIGVCPDYVEIKGMVETLLNRLGLAGIYFDDYKIGKSQYAIRNTQIDWLAEIQKGNKILGLIGQIKNNNHHLFLIDLALLNQERQEEFEYEPISKYPASVRDIALLVNIDIKVDQILAVINDIGGKLIQDVDLFDLYEGENLPQGKKNLAFHIVYQSSERTLDSKEVNKLHGKIMDELEKRLEESKVRR